jgi:hypothetical protein
VRHQPTLIMKYDDMRDRWMTCTIGNNINGYEVTSEKHVSIAVLQFIY